MKISKPEYVEKALALSHDEQQRVLSRMSGKLPKRLIKDKLSVEDAIAIQLEIEEEQLEEWRKNWEKIRKPADEKKALVLSKATSETISAKPAARTKTSGTAETKPQVRNIKPAKAIKTS